MLSKVVAVAAFMILPLSVALWHKSHHHPEHYRFDLTLYKSLRVYVKDGRCGLRLLSMPSKTASRSEFRGPLNYEPQPIHRTLMLSTARQGPYRITWLVFPFWLTSSLLITAGALPIVRGPVRRQWRKWRGHCQECGYSLWGNRSGRCPECGNRFPRKSIRTVR